MSNHTTEVNYVYQRRRKALDLHNDEVIKLFSSLDKEERKLFIELRNTVEVRQRIIDNENYVNEALDNYVPKLLVKVFEIPVPKKTIKVEPIEYKQPEKTQQEKDAETEAMIAAFKAKQALKNVVKKPIQDTPKAVVKVTTSNFVPVTKPLYNVPSVYPVIDLTMNSKDLYASITDIETVFLSETDIFNDLNLNKELFSYYCLLSSRMWNAVEAEWGQDFIDVNETSFKFHTSICTSSEHLHCIKKSGVICGGKFLEEFLKQVPKKYTFDMKRKTRDMLDNSPSINLYGVLFHYLRKSG